MNHDRQPLSLDDLLEHLGVRRPEWQRRANCKGMGADLFHPRRGEIDKARAAVEVCRGCEVVDDCFEHAVVNGESRGIWGASFEKQRRAERRRRRAAS